MKADVVFIGGGLAALVSGIKLLKEGKSVIAISAGQSALHFSSGSLCALNRFDEREVSSLGECFDKLSPDHPYRKAGNWGEVKALLEESKAILEECGIELKGDLSHNHHRLTPFGIFTSAWLTLTDHITLEDIKEHEYTRAAIVGINGFLDFYPSYLAKGLAKVGIDSLISTVNISEFNTLRNNPTEMRAPNIARSLTDEGIERYAEAIRRNIGTCDFVLIPAVVGLNDSSQLETLRDLVGIDLYSVSTIPVAVPGIRMKILLQQHFTELGGWYLLGDSVTGGRLSSRHLDSINTANLGNTQVRAKNFVLSTGGLFSRGLRSTYERITEPIFGLDVYAEGNRAAWYDRNFFHEQPFMKFGVRTDEHFRCCLDGQSVDNLYGIGGVIGGDFDPLYDGVGAGVTLVSALYVANRILKGE